MMTTMLEVAKRAGVSKATVSRVLSGNGYVSQETKDRVFQAVEESGYRPNLLARNLSAKSTQTLGLVVTNTLYHGIYFSELLFHAARMAEEKGRQLLLADGKQMCIRDRDNLPGGPLMVEGFTYIPHRFALGFAEAPRGDDIHWSMTGDNQKLYRWRCRAATYANWPTLRYMLRGNTVSDAPLIIGSLDPCYSCTCLLYTSFNRQCRF